MLFEDMGNPPSRVEDSPSLSVYAAEIRFFCKKRRNFAFFAPNIWSCKKKTVLLQRKNLLIVMNTMSHNQVELFSTPSAPVVELVKKLRQRKEQGLAMLRKEIELA